MNEPLSPPSGPWSGFETLEAAINGLRRAKFRVSQTFVIGDRGLVVEGEIIEGEVRAGMVLLTTLERRANVYVPLDIRAVESVDHSGGASRIGLVLGKGEHVGGGQRPLLDEGNILDVLDRSPTV